jgi:hypothetical protein
MQTEMEIRLNELVAEVNSNIKKHLYSASIENSEIVRKDCMQMTSMFFANVTESKDIRNFEQSGYPNGFSEYYDALETIAGNIEVELLSKIKSDNFCVRSTIQGYVREQIHLEQRKNLCVAFQQIFLKTQPDVIQQFVSGGPISYLSTEYLTLKTLKRPNVIPVTIIGNSVFLADTNATSNTLSVETLGNCENIEERTEKTVRNKAFSRIMQMHERFPGDPEVAQLYDVAFALVGKFLEDGEDSDKAVHVLYGIEKCMFVIYHSLNATNEAPDENTILEILCNAIHYLCALVFCLLKKNFSQEVAEEYLGARENYEDVIEQAENAVADIDNQALSLMMAREQQQRDAEDQQQEVDDALPEPVSSSNEVEIGEAM